MEYRKMGKTGLQLSTLSFGSWVTFHKQIDDRIADELMGIAYDAGVNFFDNAEVYAAGESEKMMGRILSQKKWDRTSIVLSSKAYFGWRGKANKPNQTGLSRKHLTEACHEALQRLQTDYLDLYFCHRPEQPQYNMFESHKMENEFVEIFKNVGMGTTIWSPLASGLLTGKYNDGIPEGSRMQIEGYEWLRDRMLMQDKIAKVQQLGALAKALKVSTASLSIAWCIKNPNVSTAILGATNKTQLLENLTALETATLLTPEIMEQIEGIIETKPVLPEW